MTPEQKQKLIEEAEQRYPNIDAYGKTFAKREAWVAARTLSMEELKAVVKDVITACVIGFEDWIKESTVINIKGTGLPMPFTELSVYDKHKELAHFIKIELAKRDIFLDIKNKNT